MNDIGSVDNGESTVGTGEMTESETGSFGGIESQELDNDSSCLDLVT